MSRSKYYFFVDEVKPSSPFTVYNFTGIAIKEADLQGQLIPFLNDAKNKSIARLGGQSVNLHFHHLVTKKGQFSSLTKVEETDLWNCMINILQNCNYDILAGIVEDNNYKNLYQYYRVPLETLAFKTLIQNFVRYLHIQNGYGEIIIESSNDNEKFVEEYYRLKFTGSKYITSDGYKQVLRGIKFETKLNLNEGLQVADFIANPVSRNICGLNDYRPIGFKVSPYPAILQAKIYKGTTNQPFEFGVRKIL
jgi:hypothetical protein